MAKTDSPEREDTLVSSSPLTQTTVFTGMSGFSPTRATVGKVTVMQCLRYPHLPE